MTYAYHTTSHSPIALWQLNGDKTDSSGNGNDLSLWTGAERYADVLPGLRGFWFDATELRISSSALRILGDITVEYIVVFDRSGLQVPAHNGQSDDSTSNPNHCWSLGFSGASLTFRWIHEHGVGINDEYLINYGLLVGVPYHVAAVRSSNVIKFYLNGRQVGAPSSTLNAPTDGSTAITMVGGEAGQTSIKGVIASVKIIGSALSDTQVQAESDATIGSFGAIGHGTEHSPVALWQFDGDLTDSSGNGYDLSSGGTVRYTELAPGLLGVLLDGSTILSRAYTAALHITGDLTVECGFVPGISSALQDLIRFGGGSGQANNTAYSLQLKNNKARSLSYLAEVGSMGTDITYNIADGLVVGTLYHIAMRRSSDQISFFVNGRLAGTASGTLTTPDGGGTGSMWIGFSGSPVIGGIASVKVIASALTDQQIEDESAAFFGE